MLVFTVGILMGGGEANKIKKGIIKTLNENEIIKIYENSTNSSHSFKAGMHKLQHTALGTSINENSRVYAFIYTTFVPRGSKREACSHM